MIERQLWIDRFTLRFRVKTAQFKISFKITEAASLEKERDERPTRNKIKPVLLCHL